MTANTYGIVTCATHPDHGSHHVRPSCASPLLVTVETLAAERAAYVTASAEARDKMFPRTSKLLLAEVQAEAERATMRERLARRRELSELNEQFETFKTWRYGDRFYETPIRSEYAALHDAFVATLTALEKLTRG